MVMAYKDANDTPLEDVTVTLYNCADDTPVTIDANGDPIVPLTTDANGEYLFDNLLPGDYYVIFDVTTADNGAEYVITTENVGGDTELDSDVNATGQSDKTGFLASGEEDLSLDAGFYVPSKLGNLVWEDYNDNGIQDAGEPGIQGVDATISGTTGDGTDITTIVANATIPTGAKWRILLHRPTSRYV